MLYLTAGCFLLLLYSYVGFPLIVALKARLRPRKWNMDETYRPTVSVILPAFNEGLVLRRCLQSLVSLNYPQEKIEIVCGSDGSTDSTNAILNEFAEKYSFVRPLYFHRQRGKMLTLNDLVAEAKNEILLFVDADVTLNPNAALSHVRHYIDPTVGGVAGRLTIASERTDGIYRSESTFLSFESALRRNEAEIGSTVGLYGGNYSMRRGLWKSLPDSRVHDDFYSVVRILASGSRLLYEEGAISTELYARSYEDEWIRKWRYSSRGLYTLRFMPHVLFRGPAAWLLWPHKILRWTTGFLALGMIAGTIGGFLKDQSWALPVLALEASVFVLVAIGRAARDANYSVPIASSLYWFFNMNLAFMQGVFDFIFSRHQPIWSQTTRIGEPAHSVEEVLRP